MTIHPTAIVDPSAKIGEGVEIGPFAIVESHVEIGPGTRIGPHAFVGQYTVLGSDNEIYNGAVVGHTPQDLKFAKDMVSHTIIGDNNTFREYCVVHRGASAGAKTVIGNHCYVMNHSHVAHDVTLGDFVIVGAGALLAGHVSVGDRAFISGNAAVHQFCRIGRIAMLRGLAGISMDIPPFCIADYRNTLGGLNRVGMKRAGIAAEARASLTEAFKMLFRSSMPLSEAIATIEAQPYGSLPEVQELVNFVRESKRGVVSWSNHRGFRDTLGPDDDADELGAGELPLTPPRLSRPHSTSNGDHPARPEAEHSDSTSST